MKDIKIKMLKRVGLAIMLLLVPLVIVPLYVRAEPLALVHYDNVPVSGDFVVAPTSKEVVVSPGQRESFNITILNRSGKSLQFILGAEDIVATDDGEGVTLLDGEVGPYTLKDYIKSPVSSVTLDHGDKVEVPITVDLPDSVSLPGLYAAVTITPRVDTNIATGASQLQTHSRIAVVVLANTGLRANEEGEIVDFRTAMGKRLYFKSPVTLAISYANTGDIHTRQTGEVVVKSMLTKSESSTQVTPWFIMPETTKSRTIDVGEKLMFGRYKASLTLLGNNAVPSSAQVYFWVISWQIIIYIVVIVLVVAFVIYRLRKVIIRRQQVN